MARGPHWTTGIQYWNPARGPHKKKKINCTKLIGGLLDSGRGHGADWLRLEQRQQAILVLLETGHAVLDALQMLHQFLFHRRMLPMMLRMLSMILSVEIGLQIERRGRCGGRGGRRWWRRFEAAAARTRVAVGFRAEPRVGHSVLLNVQKLCSFFFTVFCVFFFYEFLCFLCVFFLFFVCFIQVFLWFFVFFVCFF